jgi:hypothetical protein
MRGNKKIEALWCIDSESGREYLIDLKAHKIIAERVNGKIIDRNPPAPDVESEG